MPFPYVPADEFELELEYTAADFPAIQSESDWNKLLERALKTASERVDGWIDGEYDWRGEDNTAPFVVQTAVTRLARQRIAGIKEDGITKEDLVSGAGYDYRTPAELRAEIRDELSEAGYVTNEATISVPNTKEL